MSHAKSVPFTVAIPESDLNEMRRRIRATRWTGDFANDSWTYGVEKRWLQDLVGYWADEYDWRAAEASINRFPQYKTEIDGVPLHFIHVRGEGANPIPLVLTHGWPWTFWDWKDVIAPLANPSAHGGDPADAFDVIVVSLPGYGFSEPLTVPGLDIRRIATLWVKLMRQHLGYDRFAAAGCDWGAFITAELGHAHPEHLLGVCIGLPILPGTLHRSLAAEAFAPDEAWMFRRATEAQALVSSHSAVQGTDPQTLAYGLADSPVGMAAWLWERRRAWSDCDGDVIGLFGRDFLCTTASIYWLTNTIGTSFRIYKETFMKGWPLLHDRQPAIAVPTGFLFGPKEVLMLPRALAAAQTNLRQWKITGKGGHFLPSEQPTVVIDEYRRFFREIRH